MTRERLLGAGSWPPSSSSPTRCRPAASNSHQNLAFGAGPLSPFLTSGRHTTQLLVGWPLCPGLQTFPASPRNGDVRPEADLQDRGSTATHFSTRPARRRPATLSSTTSGAIK